SESFEFAGRLSRITSDGYVDRARSDLDSYFLQGTYQKGKTLVKALLFGGQELTYQAWNGVSQEEMDAYGRTFNSAGMYTDEQGRTRFYEREVDDYKQDHFQLHWNQDLGSGWSANLALHYTRGRGYFEQFREDDPLADYGLDPINVDGE